MSDIHKPRLSHAEFKELWRRDEERKAKELEAIRMEVATGDIPVSDALLVRLLQLFPSTAKSVLREHPGFRFSERRDHYRTSLSVMRLSASDLAESLKDFEREATAENSEIMRYKNKDRLRHTARRIQKELFSAANAAASLVDHSRRLHKLFVFSEHDAKRKEFFKEDGLHELVIALRILLHHLHVVEAAWSLSADYRTGEKGAIFMIYKAEILRGLDENADGFGAEKTRTIKRWIESAPDQIDLLRLFQEYSSRLEQFHSFINDRIEQSPPGALLDYDRCILEVDRNATRISWNALVGNWLQWEKVPDLHKHLGGFLTPEQKEALYALPRNSPEQADAVIEIIDEKGAIDMSLRERIYNLFARLSEQELDLPLTGC